MFCAVCAFEFHFRNLQNRLRDPYVGHFLLTETKKSPSHTVQDLSLFEAFDVLIPLGF
jgi:hypothetical protein